MTREPASFSPRRTKLRPPRLPNDVISRPRLLQRLNEMNTFTLVVAPAGYGKTTLISTWLAQLSLSGAWISLDDGDNDPLQFLIYFLAAVRTLFPDFGSATLEQLYSPRPRPVAELGVQIINALDNLDRDFVLAIDDYHWIKDLEIHQFLTQLLTHPPSPLRLVIATRNDPPLPWSLRTRAYMYELRARDLSFTEAETAQFLTAMPDVPPDAELVRALTAESEGWITGLRLAALHARRQVSRPHVTPPFAANRHNLVDYFTDEIITNLPEHTRDFLIRTAILDTLHGALCDYVLGAAPGGSPGASQLARLVADGVFIVALDDAGAWYRLHPLFRRALEQHLLSTHDPAEIARLYARAVAWHEEQGLLEEAISYALRGRQISLAVTVVRRHRQALLDALDFRRLEHWLRQFPPDAIARHADLLLTQAWLMQIRFATHDVRHWIEQAEILLAAAVDDRQLVLQWRGEVAALRSQLYVFMGDAPEALAAGRHALEVTPCDRFYVRSFSLVHVAYAQAMLGEDDSTLALLNNAATDPNIPRDLALLRVLQVRHFIQMLGADVAAMRGEFPKMLQLAKGRNLRLSVAWAHYFWGCASYLQNDLAEADEHFQAVLELADYAHAGAYAHSAIGLALTRQAQGRPQEAAAITASALHYVETMQLGQMQQVMRAFAAELAARQGRVAEAREWWNREGRRLVLDATPLFYIPGLAGARVLLASGADDELAAAQNQVAQVTQLAVQTRNTHAEIQAAALQAAISAAQGDRAQAQAALARSIDLAEPGGILRPYVDLREMLIPLLADLPRARAVAAFPQQVCAAVALNCGEAIGAAHQEAETFAGDRAAGLSTSTSPAPAPPFLLPSSLGADAPPDGQYLRQLLTYREMDVLRLLDQRLTNKEIARHLSISTETVRQHTVKLFHKLRVHNRRQAVVAARTLGYRADLP